MIRNRLCFEKQFDEKLYQAMIPHEGNWAEAVVFAKEFLNYCSAQEEAALKAQEEKKEDELKTE